MVRASTITNGTLLNPAMLEWFDEFLRGANNGFASGARPKVDYAQRVPGSAVEAPHWEVYLHGGRTPTGRDAVAWAREAVARGAGELLVTSMDADGHQAGYDLPLLRAVRAAVEVPVIASGGAGTPEHLYDALTAGGADAVLAASIFHFGTYDLASIKAYLAGRGIPVRPLRPAADAAASAAGSTR